MSGLAGCVLLRLAFTPADSGRVTELLRTYDENVIETRKGRHWEFVIENSAVSLSVLSTSEHAHDFDWCLAEGLFPP